MGNSLQSSEDIVNAALARIGYRMRIGSIFDGSEASKPALDIYAQTRDALQREEEWTFTWTSAPGVPAGGAAPIRWAFSYLYPANCIRLRDIVSPGELVDPNNPLPNQWDVGSSLIAGVVTKVVNCNLANAQLIFDQQVTNPAVWDAGFTEAFIASLARRLAPGLAQMDVVKLVAEDEKAAIAAAVPFTG